MAGSTIVDAGFLIALLSKRDTHHAWAAARAPDLPPPWLTCEAVLSEALHVLGPGGRPALGELLRRRALLVRFSLADNLDPVLKLLAKYSNVPMSLADACLVRMTETLGDPILLTTDEDFRIYRRHGRQTVPCATPL